MISLRVKGNIRCLIQEEVRKEVEKYFETQRKGREFYKRERLIEYSDRGFLLKPLCDLYKIVKVGAAPSHKLLFVDNTRFFRLWAVTLAFIDLSRIPIATTILLGLYLWDTPFWIYSTPHTYIEKAICFFVGYGLLNSLLVRFAELRPRYGILLRSMDHCLDIVILILTFWYIKTQSGPINITLSFTGFQFLGSLNDDDLDIVLERYENTYVNPECDKHKNQEPSGFFDKFISSFRRLFETLKKISLEELQPEYMPTALFAGRAINVLNALLLVLANAMLLRLLI